jgi:hypothetical protein
MSLIADSFLEALTCAQFIRQLVDCYYVIGVHHRKPAMIYVLYLAAQQLLYNVVVVLSLSLCPCLSFSYDMCGKCEAG